MYQNHFNLTSLPFENSPDPEFFFMGERQREILALMIHGVVSRKGLVCISGPIGSGKTTLAAVLIKHLPEDALVINITHSKASPDEMLTFLAGRLGRENPPETPLLLIEAIRSELIKLDNDDRHCVLIIDEAQYMSDDLMREIVVLTNLETPRRKLIQILLLGQKEFINKLNQPALRQLKHRVFVTRALTAMDPEQSFYYIEHRLTIANGDIEIFSMDALDLIIKYSGGIPRLINRLCDAALLGAFTRGGDRVEEKDVRNANRDLGLELDARASSRRETMRRSVRMRRSASREKPDSRAQPALSTDPSEESAEVSDQRPPSEPNNENPPPKDASSAKTPSGSNRGASAVSENKPFRRRRFKMVMFLLVIFALTIGIILNFRGKNFRWAFWGPSQPDNPEENSGSTSEANFRPMPRLREPSFSAAGMDTESGAMKINRPETKIHSIKESDQSEPKAADLKAELERTFWGDTGAEQEKSDDPATLQAQTEPGPQPLTPFSDPTAADALQDKTEGPALASTESHSRQKADAKQRPHPYSLFLDSLADRDAAVKAITQFEQKGFDPYWVKLENKGGQARYNIYSGYFESVQQAERALQESSFKEKDDHVLVMKTPYAALIGVFTSSAVLKASQELLEQAGYSSYCISDKSSAKTRLYVGAFYKLEDARKKCSELFGIGMPCRAMAR